MTEYITILDLKSKSVLYHIITEDDKEILNGEHVLYTHEGVENLLIKLGLNPDECLLMLTTEFPEFKEI